MARVAPDATAFSQRDAPYRHQLHRPHAIDRRLGRPARLGAGTRDEMSAFGSGPTYVNFTGEDDHDNARSSYPPQTQARLTAVKQRYDPANLFRCIHNMSPAGRSARPIRSPSPTDREGIADQYRPTIQVRPSSPAADQ